MIDNNNIMVRNFGTGLWGVSNVNVRTSAFSDDIDDAKPLENQRQVEMIQRGTLFKLEKSYL